MNRFNIDFYNVLLLAMIGKCVFDGGSYPLAIGIAAMVAFKGFQAFLSKQKSNDKALAEEQVKKFEERIGSLESKLALTLGSNRRM